MAQGCANPRPAREARSAWATATTTFRELPKLPRLRPSICCPPVETVVFRMVQETLTNVHHHSGSKMARIRMVRDDGGLRVEDEGRGMTAARRNKSPGPPSAFGVGLAGIRERVKQLGGRLEIEASSRGTKISVLLPLDKASLWQQHVS